MQENPSTSNPTRHTIASVSKTIRRTITEPIAAVVATNEPEEIDDALTRSFQQLEINEDELSPRQATPNPEPNTFARPSIMNSNTPAQTFNGENSTSIAVEMYIEDVEQMVESAARDEVSKAKLRRADILQWPSRSSTAMHSTSDLHPREMTTEAKGIYGIRYKALKQGNRAISDYIKAFVIGIADSINQRIVTSQLLKNGYTFDEAREVVERVYSYPSSSSNQDRIVDHPVFTTNPTLDPTAALTQILETMCNKMAEWSPRPMNQQQPSFQQSLQPSNTLQPYPHTQPRPSIVCFNCLEVGHYADQCSYAQVLPEEQEANRREVRKRYNERQQQYHQANQALSNPKHYPSQLSLSQPLLPNRPPLPRQVTFLGNMAFREPALATQQRVTRYPTSSRYTEWRKTQEAEEDRQRRIQELQQRNARFNQKEGQEERQEKRHSAVKHKSSKRPPPIIAIVHNPYFKPNWVFDTQVALAVQECKVQVETRTRVSLGQKTTRNPYKEIQNVVPDASQRIIDGIEFSEPYVMTLANQEVSTALSASRIYQEEGWLSGIGMNDSGAQEDGNSEEPHTDQAEGGRRSISLECTIGEVPQQERNPLADEDQPWAVSSTSYLKQEEQLGIKDSHKNTTVPWDLGVAQEALSESLRWRDKRRKGLTSCSEKGRLISKKKKIWRKSGNSEQGVESGSSKGRQEESKRRPIRTNMRWSWMLRKRRKRCIWRSRASKEDSDAADVSRQVCKLYGDGGDTCRTHLDDMKVYCPRSDYPNLVTNFISVMHSRDAMEFAGDPG
ncbi:MAG: hypothetical protein M1839_004105 [Geoglossum umbratile]|nr:MAG: hypothetical protein M1839_004105 [Geoglossum umbratile]